MEQFTRTLPVVLCTPLLFVAMACDPGSTAERALDEKPATMAARHAKSKSSEEDTKKAHKVESAKEAHDGPVATAAECMSDCNDAEDVSGTNRATCVMNCAAAQKAGAQSGPCIDACLESLASCMAPCSQAKLETDEESCELRCEQNAGMCDDACED